MEESKKIKKLEKVNKGPAFKLKKATIKPRRAQAILVHKPCKLFLPNSLFLMNSDLFFSLKDNKIHFDFSMLNQFKYITSVGIRKDLEEKIVTVLLEHDPNIQSSSWQEIAKQMEDIGKKDWAESITIFGEQCTNFFQTYSKIRKTINLQQKMTLMQIAQQTASKRLFWYSTYPCFELRFRLKESDLKISDMCFNETFIREAGYTLENFPSIVLTEGIPQFFPSDSPALLNSLKLVMENFLTSDFCIYEQETDFLMKAGYLKKIAYETHMLVEISEEDVILSLIFVVKKKSLPTSTYTKENYLPAFLEELKNIDKEKEYLLNTYYGEKFQGLYSNTDKVCKIRELE